MPQYRQWARRACDISCGCPRPIEADDYGVMQWRCQLYIRLSTCRGSVARLSRAKGGFYVPPPAACSGCRFARGGWHYFIASGLVGEPTAPGIGIAGGTNMKSYTLSPAQSSARSLREKNSPMVMPMIGIVIQCQGWLMPGSVLLGRTSQPQVSLASAASCVRATHSSVSKAKPGASPPGYPSQLPAVRQRSICPVRTII